MVLPPDTVMYQSQEVAAVIAIDRFIARDGKEAVKVEYEPMKPLMNPHKFYGCRCPNFKTR
jgi:Aerobic-type carbon monoxide dehydrogenase, large subunit CoxL/CutL homologs